MDHKQPPMAQNETSPLIIPNPPENPNPVSVHPVVTRFRVGSNQPTRRLNLHVSSVMPLPKSYRDAFYDSSWQNSVHDEYNAVIKNQTWTLVPRPSVTNITWHETPYLLLYVKDIVLTTSSQDLGISVTRDSSGIFLSQKKYVVEILERALMVKYNPSRTPVATESKLSIDGDPISDPTLYRSLAALKLILRYVRGTLDYGLQLFSSTTYLVAYSDVDWAGCPTSLRSTSVTVYFLATTYFLGPLSHQRTKYIEIDIHFVRDLVVVGQVRMLHVLSHYQYADIFTKGFPSALFEEFRTSLSVRCPPATTGEC
uniref:Uncharacterized protein n=1 Tax=Tanacetum cinerariifolium TaxID=118510 RepID=A0A699I8B0_TANCI|nr:hypothetical protein [Tanacetum cinerariifolium]